MFGEFFFKITIIVLNSLGSHNMRISVETKTLCWLASTLQMLTGLFGILYISSEIYGSKNLFGVVKITRLLSKKAPFSY